MVERNPSRRRPIPVTTVDAVIRLATIGTSTITERFVEAVSRVDDAEVALAFSRDLGRGRAFAERTGIPDAVDDLAALAGRVDAVYVGSPNGAHAAQARTAIDLGLHVFLEKPATTTAAEFADLIDRAAARGVVVFEGMRNVYDPGIDAVRDLLPQVGVVRRVSLALCQRSARYDLVLRGETPNIFDPALAGGALFDLGVYPLSAAVALFGIPDAVTGAIVPIATGADGAGTALLTYPGFVADIGFSKITASTRASEIQGESGTLTIDRITDPRHLVFTPVGGEPHEHRIEGHDNNMVYEVARFAALVRGEADAAPDQQRTLTVLRIVEEIRRISG
jgi:predicted dehydrogenase